MDADDIEQLKKQRLWLEDRTGTGTTRKPCPACGTTDCGMRLANKVCHRCRDLMIREINAELEESAKAGEIALSVVNYGYHEGDYHTYPGFQGARYTLEGLFSKLLLLCSRPAHDVSEPWITHKRSLPSVSDQSYSSTHRGWRLFSTALAEVLDQLDRAIRAALVDASTAGRERGANVLLALASGEITMEQFNEQTLGDVNDRDADSCSDE